MTSRPWSRVDAPLARRLMLASYAVAAVVVSVCLMLRHDTDNFHVFRDAFHRLVAWRDVYAPYPEWNDFFKYSPAFALLFGPFSFGPLFLGLIGWNLVNAMTLALGIDRLFEGDPRRSAIALALVFPEMLGAVQNCQTNALIAGLVLLAFVELERRRMVTAALAVALAAFVKLFPIGAAGLAIFHRRRERFALALGLAVIALAALPLVAMPPAALVGEYHAWAAVLARDAAHDEGLSLMGLAAALFHAPMLAAKAQLTAMIVFALTVLAQRESWSDPAFRRRALASLLIFMVVFNHRAESPSYVIAMAGMALWWLDSPRSRTRDAMIVFAFLLTSVATSDLVPASIQNQWIRPYQLKALPGCLLWLVIAVELARWRVSPAAVRTLDQAPPDLAAAA